LKGKEVENISESQNPPEIKIKLSSAELTNPLDDENETDRTGNLGSSNLNDNEEEEEGSLKRPPSRRGTGDNQDQLPSFSSLKRSSSDFNRERDEKKVKEGVDLDRLEGKDHSSQRFKSSGFQSGNRSSPVRGTTPSSASNFNFGTRESKGLVSPNLHGEPSSPKKESKGLVSPNINRD